MSKNKMIMLPREVIERALAALDAEDPYRAAVALRAALDQHQAVTNCHQSDQPQGEQEPDAFYEWWRMRPSLTRRQAWLIWKYEHKQPERTHGIGGEA